MFRPSAPLRRRLTALGLVLGLLLAGPAHELAHVVAACSATHAAETCCAGDSRAPTATEDADPGADLDGAWVDGERDCVLCHLGLDHGGLDTPRAAAVDPAPDRIVRATSRPRGPNLVRAPPVRGPPRAT